MRNHIIKPLKRELSLFNGCRYAGYEPTRKDQNRFPRTNLLPALFGFDTYINVTIGANLYGTVTVYGKAAIHIPFRINWPEFNNSICSYTADSCDSNQDHPIQASIWFNMTVAFYLWVEIDFGDLKKIIDDNIGRSALAPTSAIEELRIYVTSNWRINRYISHISKYKHWLL